MKNTVFLITFQNVFEKIAYNQSTVFWFGNTS